MNLLKKSSLNLPIFIPTLLFLVAIIGYSLIDNAAFLVQINAANQWILQHFGNLFIWSAFLLLLLLGVVYFSPLAKVKIGGPTAQPLLNKWKWFSIAICSTVAAGIIFWGTAEPLFHLHEPPTGIGLSTNSSESAAFAMSTLFMHWTFTPYAIYTITGLVFALAYYNHHQPYSIASLFYPLFGSQQNAFVSNLLNIICLIGLISGMAASLGTGLLSLMGGLESILGTPQSNQLMGGICLLIVGVFIISAASGLKKGITILSKWNTRGFFILAAIVFVLGPTLTILKIGGMGVLDYVLNFLPRSTNVGQTTNADWLQDWSVFYFANWFAWAPIASLFLGRIAVGYTVRDFINFNLIYPALFSGCWMIIFGGAALAIDQQNEGMLYQILKTQGEENVIFQLFQTFPASQWIGLFTLLLIFFSYVTIADSNVSAMSAVSSNGVNPENPEAPTFVKAIWGSLIGLIGWIMISSAGIDGIRLLCVLGGFPALFITILVGIGVVRIIWNDISSQ